MGRYKICDAGFRDRMFFGTDFPVTHWHEHRGEENITADGKSLTESYSRIIKIYSELHFI